MYSYESPIGMSMYYPFGSRAFAFSAPSIVSRTNRLENGAIDNGRAVGTTGNGNDERQSVHLLVCQQTLHFIF